MDKEALNKKLAEWAGFVRIIDFPNKAAIGHPSQKSGLYVELNFTESLDACFKWLVPKLVDGCTTADITFEFVEGDQWGCELEINHYHGMHRAAIENAEAETPSLALCLAIEKLIDGGEK